MRVKCQAEASFSVKALIPIVGCEFYESVPVEFFCGLRLCPACANRLKPHDLFSTDIKQAVRDVLRGDGRLPDFDRAKLILISINDLQLLQLEANHSTIH
jgi:hypothetical protein